MSLRKGFRPLWVGWWAVVGAVAGFAPSLWAAEGMRSVEEVVVSARRQDETLQDVPITITSVGGEQLDNYQLDQLEEVAARIPNFNIQVGGSGSGGTLNLRGVGSSAISAAFDSAVAFDIDGVQVSRMRMVQSAFMDLEQVDVLKGPQALYYGKSATAGVVAFRSANPGDEFEAKVAGGYDFGLEGQFVDAFISGPLTEQLGARLAMRYAKSDQIWENTNPDRSSDFGEEDLNARLTLVWTPSDTVNVNFKTTMSSREADDSVGNFDILCAVPGDPQESNFPGGSGLQLPSGHDCNSDDGKVNLGGHNEFVRQNMLGIANVTPFSELDTLLSRVQVDWDIHPNLTLTSVSSYFELDEEGAGAYGYDANGIGSNVTKNSTESWMQELRLAGQLNDSWSFLVGAFYQDRELIFDTAQEAVGGAYLASLLDLPTVDPVTGFSHDWRKIHTTQADTFSLFGSVTWQATERLELTAGARWSDEERTNTIDVPSIFYLFVGPGFVPPGFNSGDIEFEDRNLSPEASALYALTDNVNLFVAYKSGYKAGGIDNSALPSASLAAAANSGDFSALIFDTEEAEGFEAGMKGRFAEGAVRLDVTAFRYVYEDLQVQTFNADAIQFSTTNAGELISQGLEAELQWLPPIDGLSVYGSASLLNAEFTDTFIPEPPVGITDPAVIAQYDLDGRSSSGAADLAFNLGFDFTRPLGNTLQWGLNVNTSWTDEYETQNEDPIGYVQDAFWLLNGRLFLGAADGRWNVSLMGRNITDELVVATSGGRPFANVSNNSLLPGGIGFSDTILNYGRGRQVFAQFEVRL